LNRGIKTANKKWGGARHQHQLRSRSNGRPCASAGLLVGGVLRQGPHTVHAGRQAHACFLLGILANAVVAAHPKWSLTTDITTRDAISTYTRRAPQSYFFLTFDAFLAHYAFELNNRKSPVPSLEWSDRCIPASRRRAGSSNLKVHPTRVPVVAILFHETSLKQACKGYPLAYTRKFPCLPVCRLLCLEVEAVLLTTTKNTKKNLLKQTSGNWVYLATNTPGRTRKERSDSLRQATTPTVLAP
jgi:hypothetical protein